MSAAEAVPKHRTERTRERHDEPCQRAARARRAGFLYTELARIDAGFAAVAAAAVTDARAAAREGATAPWGDGETLPALEYLPAAALSLLGVSSEWGVDVDLRREIYATYNDAFRVEFEK